MVFVQRIKLNNGQCATIRMKFMNVGKQGRIQDFKLGGAYLKKIVPSGGRREMFLGISCEKSHQVCSPPGKTFHEEHI